MSISIPTIVISGALFLLIFLTGFRLRRTGQPYPMLLVTIHKFLSLGVTTLLVVTLYPVRFTGEAGRLAMTAAIVSGVLLAVAIISGGLCSINRSMPVVVRALHWAAPFLSVISIAGLFYLLER